MTSPSPNPLALGLTKGKIVDVMPAEVFKVLGHWGLPSLAAEGLSATMQISSGQPTGRYKIFWREASDDGPDTE